MSRAKHDDDCPGCLPVLCEVDEKTGKAVPLPNDSPGDGCWKWWETVARPDKEAFHRFTCNGSKADADLKVIAKMIDQMQEVMK